VVFQSSSLDLKLTVAENLTCQGHLYGLAGKALRQRSRELLLRLGLEGRTDDRAESLSGGLRRRLEIAKGLLHRPPLLLLDEPSTGLDARARHELRHHLTELRDREEVTVVVTTHFMDEGELCDHLAILDCGRLVAAGTPERLKKMIGGDVLVLGASDPGKLSQQIQERFGGEPKVVGGCVRLERPQGHAFIPRLAQAFPGEIDSITVSKPTLEDVFIHLTGHRFEEEPSLNGEPQASPGQV
jgi:ABC-2 type transport system ATP-binding protein